MQDFLHEPRPSLIGFLAVRRAVGFLGALLPWILCIGAFVLFGTGIQESVSSYFHTGMRDVFVGVLFGIGLFLFSYRGYERKDAVAGTLAGVFSLGVALFPVAPAERASEMEKAIGVVHFSFAALLFLTLAYFSLRLFTMTNPNKPPTPEKLRRNQVYRICGYAMLAAIALIALLSLLPERFSESLAAFHPVFCLELLALLAFGFSWLTKGEAILRDAKGH